MAKSSNIFAAASADERRRIVKEKVFQPANHAGNNAAPKNEGNIRVADTMDTGYLTVTLYSSSDCTGMEYYLAMQYGTCLLTEQGTGAARSLMQMVTGPDSNNVYTLNTTYYDTTTCTNLLNWEAVGAQVGNCSDGFTLTGTETSYEPNNNAINFISYNTQADCQASETSTVTTATYIPLDACMDITSGDDYYYYDDDDNDGDDYYDNWQSTKYASCMSYTLYSNSNTCDSSMDTLEVTYNYNFFDDDSCNLADDDDDDDNAQAAEYQQTLCLSTSAAGLTTTRGGVLGFAALAVVAAMLW